MSIIITGGSGRLGSEILKYWPQIIAPSSKELDITDRLSVQKFFKRHKAKIIIHAAAMTDVCNCEIAPNEALRVNVLGVINLFEACRKEKKKKSHSKK